MTSARRLRALFLRLWHQCVRRPGDADFAAELESHLQFHIDDNMRGGMSPDDARREALAKLGGVEQTKERYRDRRGFPALDSVWTDVRHAVRALTKRPILLLTTTLSIGIGAGINVAIHGALYRMLFDSGITATDRDRLARVNLEASYPLFADLRASGVFQDLAARQITTVTWRTGNGTSSVSAGVVSANFFDVLGVRPIAGMAFDASNEFGKGGPDRTVITLEFWQRRLGADPNVVGRALQLDGWLYTIAGVLPKGFYSPVGPLIAPELYVPISTHVATALDERNAPQLALIGRLHGGTTLAQTSAALRVVGQRIEAAHPEEHRGLGRSIHATSSSGLISLLTDGDDMAPEIRRIIFGVVTLLYAIALLVLLIACANVAGLLAARAAERGPEIAVRLALGATRARIVQQFLAESAVVAALGCTAGALLWITAATVLPNLPVIVNAGVNIVPGPLPLFYCMTLVVLVSLACGVVPAIAANQTSPATGLRNRSTTRRWTISRLLVAGQVAVCFMLLAGACVLLFSLARQSAADPGFDVEHTIATTVRLPRGPQPPGRAARGLFDWRVAIEGIPGVTSVSYARYLPLGFLTWRANVSGGTGTFSVDIHPVGPRYLETIGIPLERGRDFVDDDIPSSYGGTPAIVNHTLAERYFPGVDPIGRQLELDQDPGRGRDRKLRIVGVARDSKLRSLSEGRHPVLYLPEINPTLIVRVGGPAGASVRSIERTLADFDPTAAVTVRTLSDQLSFTLMPARIATMLLTAFGGIGLLLAMVGLHGIVTYSVNRRMFEIGIRIALGATRAAIMKMVLADAVVVVGAGSIAGGVLALVLIRSLWPLLTGTQSTMTPAALGAVLLLLLGIGILASLRPARRAATTDPIVALRHD